MLVSVHLHGPMGKEFGKEWNLAIKTPREALALIDANTGRLFHWMRANLQKYKNYRVFCIFKNGKKEFLTKDTLLSANNIQSVHFAPVVTGSGKWGKIIAGVVLMVASYWLGPMAFQAGLALVMSGGSELLAPKGKTGSTRTSHYFQGATNTVQQGDPVPLIYGRIKTGASPISVRMTVNELSAFTTTQTNQVKGFLHGSSNQPTNY
ncbi:tail assembly protein [Acinetobacter baumannii]|uniref:tail assembly protein n=1 Tax=Acinetobacter baumannii TaxID=470 RepID=UPI00044D74B4|nr:tail assembly protein [Acinetobacter baumannii]EYS40444.1 hypothetical protein J970_1674 [Acinetobacter baumannii 26016_4]